MLTLADIHKLRFTKLRKICDMANIFLFVKGFQLIVHHYDLVVGN